MYKTKKIHISKDLKAALKFIPPETLEAHGVIKPAKTKVNGRQTYICECGNGTGKSGDGLVVYENPDGFSFKCYGECGKTFDNIELLKKYYNADFNDACARAAEEFGYSHLLGNLSNNPARQQNKKTAVSSSNASKIEEMEQAMKEKYLEYTQADIVESRKNLSSFVESQGGKWRGLTLETLEYFGCGYLPNWIHPQTRAQIQCNIYNDKDGKPKKPPKNSRRFIIPTNNGKHYNAVALSADRPQMKENFWKMHAGEKQTFGLQTLTSNTEFLFVFEGEIDAMSAFQVFQIINSSNIGFIATLSASAFQWYADLDNLFSGIEKKPIIMIVGDGDETSRNNTIKHRQELLKRGYPAFVYHFTDDNKKLDANEILTQEGDAALFSKLQDFWNNAETNLDSAKTEIKKLQEEMKADEEKKKAEKEKRSNEQLINKLLYLPQSDMDNATRIAIKFGGVIRFNTDTEFWGFYENGIWKFETSSNSALYPFTREIAEIIKANTPELPTPPKNEDGSIDSNFEITDEQRKHVSIVESLQRSWRKQKTQRNAIEMLKGVPEIFIKSKELDAHPNLINCKNGVVVDLRTGKYFPASADFYLTQQAGANFNPNWQEDENHIVEKFLRDILPNKDFREFLIMWLAYCLTGEVNEEKFLFIKGRGGNGKGTLEKVFLQILGDYGCSFPIGSILHRKNYDANAATTAINILENKRAAFAGEIPLNAKTDPAQIKLLTGGDAIPIRKNYGEYQNINPTAKITFSGNNDLHFPDANDYGIKRRLINIPFKQDFTGDNADLTLKAKLLEQSSLDYFFNKLIRKAKDWYVTGLQIPEIVKTTSADYLKSQDFIADFIAENCECDTNAYITRADFVKRLRDEYPRETPTNNQDLKEMLEKIEGVTYKRDKQGYKLYGIKWRD